MIETVWNFGKRGIVGYGIRLIATTHPYLSGLISAGVCYGYFGITKPIRVTNLTGVFVTYDTVVFGFTATAIALAIAIPSTNFVAFLSSIKNGRTPFRDFLFILAWNGVVHIIAFFALFPAIALGDEWKIEPSTDKSIKLYLFFALWIQIYACFQFLVTTIGVYELGDLYANYVSKKRDEVR